MLNVPKYIEFDDLVNTIASYNKNSNISLITSAFEYAKEKHGDQIRKSKHPYYTHPLAVANIVATLKLDDISIITALLHDVIEDTDVTFDEISEKFGLDVAQIVEGVTKLSSIEYKSDEIKETENLRKLFFALSKDIRVLIVKLCDRLHNMMTLEHISSLKKRRAKAIETLEIYAPLAERIGMYQMRDILQDLSFAVINPRARNSVVKRVNEILTSVPGDFLKQKATSINQTLKEYGINCETEYRIKTIYSIWRKMQNKNITFNEINDIIGYRIIIDSDNIDVCYKVLGIIHSIYKFIPNSLMDYISIPKQNGYKSLHTVAIDQFGVMMEFQIRTRKMHEEAELGLAAHWGYKTGNNALSSEDLQHKWIERILEILNSSSSNNDILEYTKLEMYKSRVFAFTKDGDIVHLPARSKILDFAFAVNVDKASKFISAKVNNGTIYDLDFEIKNGDRIELVIGKNPTLSYSWLKYVTTGKAKHSIAKMAENIENHDKIANGMLILNKACSANGIKLNQDTLNIILRQSSLQNTSDLYLKCFSGCIDPMKLIQRVFEKDGIKLDNDIKTYSDQNNINYSNHNYGINCQRVNIKNVANAIGYISKCCDINKNSNIVGIMNAGYGIFLHNSNCENLNKQTVVHYPTLSININDIENFNDISRLKIVANFTKDLMSFIKENSQNCNAKIDHYTRNYNEFSDTETFVISGNNVDLEKISNKIEQNFPNIDIKIMQHYEKI